MKNALFVLAVFVGGCYSATEQINPEDWRHMQAARGAWMAVGLPDLPGCLDGLDVVSVPDFDVPEVCHRNDVGACALRGAIVVPESYSGQTRLNSIRHESMHHLSFCAFGDWQKGHDNPLIWRDAIALAYEISK